MSRIGKKPQSSSVGFTATVRWPDREDEGAQGESSFTMPEQIKVEKTTTGIEVTPREETKKARSMWGMSRTMVHNLIKGVTDGYSHTLEIHGVGFKASMKGKDQLDPRHRLQPRRRAHDPGRRRGEGRRRQAGVGDRVGHRQAGRRTDRRRHSRLAQPEPYQGKGVRYQGEYIFRKEGKKK